MNIASAAALLLHPIPFIAGWVLYLTGLQTAGLIALAVGTLAALLTSAVAWAIVAQQSREARQERAEIEKQRRRINDALDRMTTAAEDA